MYDDLAYSSGGLALLIVVWMAVGALINRARADRQAQRAERARERVKSPELARERAALMAELARVCALPYGEVASASSRAVHEAIRAWAKKHEDPDLVTEALVYDATHSPPVPPG